MYKKINIWQMGIVDQWNKATLFNKLCTGNWLSILMGEKTKISETTDRLKTPDSTSIRALYKKWDFKSFRKKYRLIFEDFGARRISQII